MKRMVAATAVLAVAISACGGGGRPSTGEIEDALSSEDNALGSLTSGASDEVVTCMAVVLHDSDLSDSSLQALVDNDEDASAEDGDDEAMADIQDELAACVTG